MKESKIAVNETVPIITHYLLEISMCVEEEDGDLRLAGDTPLSYLTLVNGVVLFMIFGQIIS